MIWFLPTSLHLMSCTPSFTVSHPADDPTCPSEYAAVSLNPGLPWFSMTVSEGDLNLV